MVGQQSSFELQDAQKLHQSLLQFKETLTDEWSQVLNQWENLKSVWHDEQFARFEPLFDALKETYRLAEDDCEGYTSFIDKQIQTVQAKNSRLGELNSI